MPATLTTDPVPMNRTRLFVAAVLSVASLAASAQTVEFSYKQRGMSGGMTVMDLDKAQFGRPVRFELNTVNVATHHACRVHAVEHPVARIADGERIEMSAAVVDEDTGQETGETFTVVFMGNRALVEIDSPPSGYCGVSATYAGVYQEKQSAPKRSSAR